MLEIKEKIVKNLGVIIIVIILLFTLGAIIYFKDMTQNITITFNNVTVKRQKIQLEARKYIKMFGKMKKNMILEKEDYDNIIYGNNIMLIEKHDDYYEVYLVYESKVIYKKYQNNVDNEEQEQQNVRDVLNESQLDNSISMKIQPRKVNEKGLIKMSLYKVDKKYYYYFLDLYKKLKE
jgi:hypothetical protein